MKHLNYVKYLPKVKFNNVLKVGTDCSGIEAPIQALEILNIKYQHMFSSEIDERTRKILLCNYQPNVIYKDITARNHSKLPKLDLYVAGFPCQSFSGLGKREGFLDQNGRGTIFFECFETIKSTKPEMFILENVKGLVNHDNGQTFDLILKMLKTLNYHIYHKVINTLDFGLPQNRERIYIIGLKKGKFCKFEFPEPIELKVYVTDILEKNVKTSELTDHKKKILRDAVKSKIIASLTKKEPWIINLNCSSSERSSPMYNISPCLMASGAIYYITSEKRNLTPIEFLRLQGFKRLNFCDEYSKIYSVAGNSMSVSVIAFLIATMMKCKI